MWWTKSEQLTSLFSFIFQMKVFYYLTLLKYIQIFFNTDFVTFSLTHGLFIHLFIVFFHEYLSLLCHLHLPPAPASPHCCLCPWVFSLFFFSAWLLHPCSHAALKLSACCLSVSVSILLVNSVCLLDSTYEWNHVVIVFLFTGYLEVSHVVSVPLGNFHISFFY